MQRTVLHYIITLFLVFTMRPCVWGANFYVSLSGNDKSGDGSISAPWRTIKHACASANDGQSHTINIDKGTFVETRIVVPPGVSLLGKGQEATILKALPSFYYHPSDPGFGMDRFLVSLVSPKSIQGKQSIRKLTIDGDQRQLHGGIFIQNRHAVTVEQVTVQYVNFSGIWLWGCNNSILKDIKLKDCAWGNTGWCSGALQVANSATVDISKFDIDEGRGYGIKNLGQVTNTPVSNMKIHDGRISVNPTGLWNNGAAPNISIELWGSGFPGTEIYNCYVDNHISVVTHPAEQRTTGLKIYNNTFDLLGARTRGRGYCLELSAFDVEVYNNWFNGGTTAIVNWGDRIFSNWSIHHNTFYGIASEYPTAIINSYKGGIRDADIYNNTIEFTGTSTVNFIEINSGGLGENLIIRNNLIINSNKSYAHYKNRFISLEKGAKTKNLTVQNNFFSNLSADNVSGTISNNYSGDPGIRKSGARPGSYYIPAPGSPLIDAGQKTNAKFEGKAPDIGAFEFSVTK